MKLALTLKVKGAGNVIPLNDKTPACHFGLTPENKKALKSFSWTPKTYFWM